jgi:hypothetical protein
VHVCQGNVCYLPFPIPIHFLLCQGHEMTNHQLRYQWFSCLGAPPVLEGRLRRPGYWDILKHGQLGIRSLLLTKTKYLLSCTSKDLPLLVAQAIVGAFSPSVYNRIMKFRIYLLPTAVSKGCVYRDMKFAQYQLLPYGFVVAKGLELLTSRG